MVTHSLMILFGLITTGIVLWAAYLFPKRYPHLPDWEAKVVALLGYVPIVAWVGAITFDAGRPNGYDQYGQLAFLAYVFAYLPFFFWWHKKLVEREHRAKLEAEGLQNIAARDALLGEITSFKKPPVSEFLAALQRNLDGVNAPPEIATAFVEGAAEYYGSLKLPENEDGLSAPLFLNRLREFMPWKAKELADRFRLFLKQLPPERPADARAIVLPVPHTIDAVPDRLLQALFDFCDFGPYGQILSVFAMASKMAERPSFANEREKMVFLISRTPFVRIAPHLVQRAAIPQELRFEHSWLLGPSGSGKTTILEHLIHGDIRRSLSGELPASVVVMDSQGDLISKIAHLDIFPPGELILLEPESIAFNPFELKGELAAELLTYVFSALGDAFTPKQETLYRYCIRLLQEVPGATIMSFLELLQRGGIDQYRDYIPKLSRPAQIFFNDAFSAPKEYTDTKQEVARRLMLLLESSVFERMFGAAQSKIDLFEALAERKTILMDTNKRLLGAGRSSLMGRFFIALLLLASQQRASMAKDKRLPVFCYIDEAHEYLQDDKVADILDQARKMRIAMFLANQRLAQIKNPNMLDALGATAIKFVHGKNDAPAMARFMGTTADEISALPKHTFGLSVRGEQAGMVPVRVPPDTLERERKLSEPDYRDLRELMHRMYGPDEESLPPISPPETPKDKEPSPAEDEDDTAPKRW